MAVIRQRTRLVAPAHTIVGSGYPKFWASIPSITFQGSSTTPYQLSQNVANYNSNTDRFSLAAGSASLPSWLTLSATTGALTPNGTQTTSVSGLNFRVTRNAGYMDTGSLTVTVQGVRWASVPNVNFQAGSIAPYQLGQNVQSFNAATDTFSLAPGSVALPSWLVLTASGSLAGNLTPNGTQTDVMDFTGLNIRVTRAGATADSGAFAVGVSPAPVVPTNVIQWKITTIALPGQATVANPALPARSKHARWVRNSANNCWYLFGGDYPHETAFGGVSGEGGVNATLKYNPATRVWTSEYPFCGKVGQYFAAYHDETAMCYDTLRGKFWITEGYQGASTTCAYDGGATMGIPTIAVVQTFNPVTQDWEVPFGLNKRFFYNTFGGGQHVRTVYDAARDRVIAIFDGSPGISFSVFNCVTGAWSQEGPITPSSIQSTQVSRGQTQHIVGNNVYWIGASGTTAGKRLYEANITTRAGRMVAELPFNTFDDQDFSYIPTIDSFLVWTEHPNVFSFLIHRVTGALSAGPASPPLSDYLPFRPQHNNYDPTIDKVILGWSQHNDTAGKLRSEYYEYEIDENPDWLPTAGTVKAINTDAWGGAVNYLTSVAPTGTGPTGPYSNLWGSSANGISGETRGWGGAAYARDFSANGAIIVANGGDGDYYGTEVYAFDLTTRRWQRLNNPHTNLTGSTTTSPHEGVNTDHLRATTDPYYFSELECEHGPLVAPDFLGLLPTGTTPTTPGLPHTYDSNVWVPGSVIGNRRGALVRCYSVTVYNNRRTSRSHYFDLDAMRWGRLTARMANPPNDAPTCAYDEQLNRIYHNLGYIDLTTRAQIPRSFGGLPYSGVSAFDPVRRLWVNLTNNGLNPSTAPGGMRAMPVDSSNNASLITLVDAAGSTRWKLQDGYCGGLQYCPDLDCFFVYTQGLQSWGYIPQKLWKVQPPSSSPMTNPWTVTEIGGAAGMPGDAVAADPSGIGTFKRFLWISSIKCFAIYNGSPYTGKIYLYKPEGL